MKERQAVHTIMEQKIKVLVQSISQAVSVVLQNSQGGGPTGHALAKVGGALVFFLTRFRMLLHFSDWSMHQLLHFAMQL